MINVAVIGIEGVGKTSYINRLVCGTWENCNDYKGFHNKAQNARLTWETNKGIIHINLHEYSNCNIGENRIKYDGIIIMFACKTSYECAKIIYDRLYGQSPTIILCFNKCDITRDIKQKNILFHRRNRINMYDISAKTLHNFEKPIIDIVESHIGKFAIDSVVVK
jgi:GTPase SAR1 family protein